MHTKLYRNNLIRKIIEPSKRTACIKAVRNYRVIIKNKKETHLCMSSKAAKRKFCSLNEKDFMYIQQMFCTYLDKTPGWCLVFLNLQK